MDRRDFFKTVLSTSLMTPLILATKNTDSDLELYMISDRPHDHIPALLKAFARFRPSQGKTYAFLEASPKNTDLSRTLENSGWTQARTPQQADLALSFTRLSAPARPSFTLVRKGEILDIRGGRLSRLWEQMGRMDPSDFMTTARCHNPSSPVIPGRTVHIFGEGKRLDTLRLDRPARRTFETSSGRIVIRVENRSARVEESSCMHKVCSYTHPVSLAGERIICAPNHFMLVVPGDGAVDTIIG